MKRRTPVLISVVILVSLMMGAYAISVLSAPKPLKLKIMWKPATYVMNTSLPNPWTAEIFFAPPRAVDDINIYTILLENYWSWDPLYPPEHHPLKERLNVYFNGYDVLDAIFREMPHMGPGTYVVPLEITGQLNDGTPFSGSGTITLVVDGGIPP